MLNLDVVPSKMTGTEIKAWLNECSAEIEKAYNDDNVAYAQKLDSIYRIVKQMCIEKLQEESFTNYLKYANFLNESVTEEGNQEIDLLEVDENIESLKKKLKDCEINVSATATLDENLKVVDFSPITVDIAFKLAYIDEKQHILLTYTATEIPTFLDIESIPKRDYKNTPTETGMEVSFKSITNLADELTGQVTFKESIEWPFEMDFKSVAVEKIFNKNASLVAKIVALLGKEQLINKVSGYQSTHSSGSNRQTRAHRKDEEIRSSIRAQGPFKSRSQILHDALAAIPGVTNVTEFDVPGNGKYYKRLRLIFHGGVIDVYNGGLNFMVNDNVGGFGNKREFITDTEDRTATVNDTRNKMLAYVKKRIETMQGALNLAARRTEAPTAPRRPQTGIKAVYDEFVKTAEEIIAGTSDQSISSLEHKYDQLMDSERFLTDEQMAKIEELANELNL